MYMKDFRRLKIAFLALFFALTGISDVSATPSIDERILASGRRCVELVFEERFTEAHQVANRIIRDFPDSPAGYFFRAAVFHYQMLHLRNTAFEREFYEACARGTQIGENNRHLGCPWNDFFMAATIGVQGAFDRVQSRLVSSLRLATRAIEIFRELDESQMPDVLYGTGVFDYWTGANARLLWWMPGIRDNRQRGLANLERVRRNGVFTRFIVNFDLMEMYANESRWSDVKRIANDVLRRYPSNTTALWALFEAHDALRENDERDAISARIRENIEKTPNNENMLRHFQRRTRRH